MSTGGTRCPRLCRLIQNALSPYTEEEVVSVIKEKEKLVLVALSQVFSEIQLWIQELDGNSDSSASSESVSDKECSGGSDLNQDHRCLIKIVADLVGFLTAKSQFIQHLAGNVLVIISEFVAVSGSNWDELVHSLCVCLELLITKLLSSSASSISKCEDSNHDATTFHDALEPRLKNANWSTTAGILRVLRNMLKFLKQESNDNLLRVYFDSVNIFISKVPWNLLDVILVIPNGDTGKGFCVDDLYSTTVDILLVPIPVFLGNFVQFLSSLVGQCDFREAAGCTLNNHPVLSKIVSIVPNLLSWCFDKLGNCVDMRLSLYFRHKFLVLMIRLSFQIHLGCSILVLWLKLLHNYFPDLLQHPIKLCSGLDDCLEDSPFLLSIFDEEGHSLRSQHLQRLAIFLFLRCSFSLISLKGHVEKPTVCATPEVCLTYDSDLGVKCDGCDYGEKGLLELHKWVQGHLATHIFVDHEMYTANCAKFASSFLQLYVHEDDLLFKVLLQLLEVPFPVHPRFHEEGTYQVVKEDVLIHVSNLFNPVNFFHLFLAELHYDHQVLLDYLISRDAGIYCLEYILRCLRIVTDSWHLFVEFPADWISINQSSYKKRKVLSSSSSALAKLPSPTSPDSTNRYLEDSKVNRENSCKHYGAGRKKPFEEAKECLLSLKKSVENLHRKNLFSYNPTVLIKRLSRFLELCAKEKK